MKKKIQITILTTTILLITTNFVGITTANNNINTSLEELSYFPQLHNFGDMQKGKIDNATFEIWNSGCCTLHYEFLENKEWIEVEPTSGHSTGEHDIIKVNINTANLALGFHEGDITIVSSKGNAVFKVTVNIIPNNAVIDITVEEAWNLLNNTSNGIQIPIDVRTENEWKNEHIDTPSPENPQHHNYLEWSNPSILQDFISNFNGKELIIYCGVGGRSKTAANILIENEFNGIVYNMLGGITDWKNKGYPTEGYTTFEIINLQGKLGYVTVDIKNNGTFTAKNISAEIKVVGGFFSMIDMTSTCIGCPIPLEPDATTTESTRKDGLIFGFGPIEITVSAWANNVDKITIQQEAFILGLLIILR
jgi:rhodanese-related sulfurtransferase